MLINRIPYESPMRDGHDWYCFVCHQPGEVHLCRNCWRVVHPNCLEPHQVGISPPFHCYVCEAAKTLTLPPKSSKNELNKLLGKLWGLGNWAWTPELAEICISAFFHALLRPPGGCERLPPLAHKRDQFQKFFSSASNCINVGMTIKFSELKIRLLKN